MIGFVEAAIKSKSRPRIESCVDPLFHTLRQLVDDNRTGEDLFRFCVNRLVSLRRFRHLALPDEPLLTDNLLRILISRPCDTDVICRYLAVTPLADSHGIEIVRLLTAEPLCIYEWQNYHLWLLCVQKDIRSPQLLAKAHSVVAENASQPQVAGAVLFLGKFGDYSDLSILKDSMTRSRAFSSQRCYFLATQHYHPEERAAMRDVLMRDDDGLRGLGDYLAEQDSELFAPQPPPLGVDELFDYMPDKLS